MGCASSKRIEAAAIDVYRPPPTSFAVFDINGIEEPWLKAMEAQQPQEDDEKPTHHQLPPPLLVEKLNSIEDAPRSWDEVSKALDDLKPTLQNTPTVITPAPKTPLVPSLPPAQDNKDATNGNLPRKNFSFHTLEELEEKISPNKKTESTTASMKKYQSTKSLVSSGTETNKARPAPASEPAQTEGSPYKPVKENIFILRDRLEREKEGGKVANMVRFNPLSDFPEMCPPGGADSVVIYTTSLGGVRRTYEDCNKVRLILESHRFVFEERDVSLHGEFLNELRELLGEGVSVPRMFVKGRYVGGVEQVVNLNETGRLGRILNWARVERGLGRMGCEGCGGARFVPCLDCGGSCKVMVNVGDDNKKMEKERCPSCNENGLVLCPLCD